MGRKEVGEIVVYPGNESFSIDLAGKGQDGRRTTTLELAGAGKGDELHCALPFREATEREEGLTREKRDLTTAGARSRLLCTNTEREVYQPPS
eukprot:1433276-Rhodomonas_salina.2